MSTQSKFASLIAATALVTLSAIADDTTNSPAPAPPPMLPPASTKTGVTFDTDIKPIFAKSCFKCHGPAATTPKARGRLRLDSVADVLKGGKDAPDITPGDSAKSDLVADVAHTGDPDSFMPPPKSKIPALTADQIGLIRAWIDQGAK